MAIEVRDLTPDFVDFVAAAHGFGTADRAALWRRTYVERHRDVFDVYFRRDPSIVDGLDDLLDRLCGQADQLRIRAAALRGTMDDALAQAADLLGLDQDDVDAQAILMVGLFGSNGWVDELAGRDELFVAVEQIRDDDQRHGRLLLVHEAAHVVHSRLRAGPAWPTSAVAARLLAEGLATDVSHQAMPELSAIDCLWFSDDYQPWLDECGRRRGELAARLLADVDAEDEATELDYFAVRRTGGAGQLPQRCGYFIGWEVIRWLRGTYTVADIARWDYDRAKREARAALSDLTRAW